VAITLTVISSLSQGLLQLLLFVLLLLLLLPLRRTLRWQQAISAV
jgi:hypothetical protein